MRRPTIIAAVSLSLALVAGLAAVALTRDHDGGTASLAELRDDPGYDLPVVPRSPSPPATPSPTPVVTATPAAATPRPTSTTTATATRAADDGVYAACGPSAPGSVSVPYRAGQTSWDVTTNGFHVRIAMSAVPRAGTPMTWRITAANPAAKGCCAIYLLYGDSYAQPPNGLPCDAPDPSVAWEHAYNRAGTHRFMVQVADAKQCGGANGVVYGVFDVTPGASTAQGPALPVVKFDRSIPVKGHEGDDAWITLWGEATDDDGWIRRLVVHFGDGTSAKVYGGDEGPCRPGGDGWPFDSHAQLPYDPPDYHHFTKPGTYTVTLTATSTACDGSTAQTGQASFEWVVPAPESPAPAVS